MCHLCDLRNTQDAVDSMVEALTSGKLVKGEDIVDVLAAAGEMLSRSYASAAYGTMLLNGSVEIDVETIDHLREAHADGNKAN